MKSTISFVLTGVLAIGWAACTTENIVTAPSSSQPAGATPGTGGAGGGAGEPALDRASCEDRCVTKVNACGGVPVSAENPRGTAGFCENVCGGGLTNEQMTCLEGKSCAQLAGASSLTSLCPGPSGSTSGGASGNGGNGGGGTAKSAGDACTCSTTAGEAGVYKMCTGNASACFDMDLSCLADITTGKGTCVVPCGSGGTCPGGGSCRSSGRKAIDGTTWKVCD